MPRLYPTIRPGARYYASLRLLESVKRHDPSIFTKSGVMVGLGEQRLEVHQVMDDMRSADVDFLTMGQYLQPTPRHAKVEEFVTPKAFEAYAAIARAKGFLLVAASPLTRSSYHAGDDFEKMRAAREAKLAAVRLRLMPRHRETRLLPYTPEQLFDLVADVGRYQEFLPWVAATRVRSNSETEMVADLVVGFSALKETFTSRVRKERPREIEIDYIDGPLKYLHNRWTFAPAPEGTAVDFCVDFAFKNRIFEALAGQDVRRRAEEDDRRLRGARGRALCAFGQQQLQRAKRRLSPHPGAAEIAELAAVGDLVALVRAALGAGEDDHADRLVLRSAAGAGDAGDRDRDIGAGPARSRPAPSPRRRRSRPSRTFRSRPEATPSTAIFASFE